MWSGASYLPCLPLLIRKFRIMMIIIIYQLPHPWCLLMMPDSAKSFQVELCFYMKLLLAPTLWKRHLPAQFEDVFFTGRIKCLIHGRFYAIIDVLYIIICNCFFVASWAMTFFIQNYTDRLGLSPGAITHYFLTL